MTLSIWRYCHLGFALTFSAFILIASLTGIILAIEPIEEQFDNKIDTRLINKQTVAKTIKILKNSYKEVYSFEINTHNKAIAYVVLKNGKNKRVYINPINGKEIGPIKERKYIYKWTTILHRSLFFKKTGRVLMGLCSFFLSLITITGIILIFKRQGGGVKFFKKVIKESNQQYYHVILGRWFILPILIITISGILLSLEKLRIFPIEKSNHKIDFSSIKSAPKLNITNFNIFNKTLLSKLKKIEFPFSDDVNDYYTLYLDDKEVLVNQITGEIISEYIYPINNLTTYYSYIIHTGHGNFIWSFILLLVCLSILYFMYSGFAMTRKRSKYVIKNSIHKKNAKVGIFVGSEGGSTIKYANTLHQQLLKQNINSYIAELNKFEIYKNLEQIIILTATYGDGEPPANGRKFINKLDDTIIDKEIEYSILGFGSIAYKNFCQFAYDIKYKIQTKTNTKEAIPLATINNNSFEEYTNWANQISNYLGVDIKIQKEELGFKKLKTHSFKVKYITPIINRVDNTFLLKLDGNCNLKYQSGDLLAIYPKNESKERLYSISKTKNGEILIAVKKHEHGKISNFLSNKSKHHTVQAAIVRNSSFYFPKKSKQVIFIATGTGIGPFLGMIENNRKKVNTILYWGGKTKNSFNIYNSFIQKQIKNGNLQHLYTAFSRENNTKTYIQDIVSQQADFFANALKDKTVIMICGSVTMQKDLLRILNTICISKNKKPLSYYQNKGQILMDCY